jgi:hypothetical protein
MIQKKNKNIDKDLEEINLVKSKLRVLHYNILKYDSKQSYFTFIDKEDPKKYADNFDPSRKAFEDIGFHGLAMQWAELCRK